MLLPAVFAAWAVIEPEGWVRDAELVGRIKAQAADVVGLDVSAFHPPGEPTSSFVVEHGPQVIAFELAYDQLRDQLETARWAQIAQSDVKKQGYHRKLVELVSPDGSEHVAIRVATTRSEGVLGVCRASPATIEACRRQLDKVDVGVDPDDSMNSSIRDIVLGIIGLAVGATVAAILVSRWRRRRDLRRSAPLVDGELVTIAGTVRAAADVIEAPLSGRACVFHRSHARLFARNAADRIVAEPSEQDARPFFVDTAHGSIRVDEPELALELAPTMVVASDTPGQRAFVARHTDAPDASAAFDEIVIAPGAKVTLRGVVRLEHDLVHAGERGYRDSAPTIARLVAAGTDPVAVLRTW